MKSLFALPGIRVMKIKWNGDFRVNVKIGLLKGGMGTENC